MNPFSVIVDESVYNKDNLILDLYPLNPEFIFISIVFFGEKGMDSGNMGNYYWGNILVWGNYWF